MSTLQSSSYSAVFSSTINIPESNPDGTYISSDETSGGLYIVPTSDVPGRTDITGYVLKAVNSDGKVFWDAPSNFDTISLANGSATDPSLNFQNSTHMGLYRVSADNLGFSTASTLRMTLSSTGVLSLSNLGTSSLPSYTWDSDPNTGIWNTADTLHFSTGGTDQLSISSTGVVSLTNTGSASLPAITFVGNNNTGFYSSASNTLNFTTNGSSKLSINSTGVISLTNLGTASLPSIVFSTNTTSGFYSPSADTIGIATSATARVFVGSTGNVGIGTTSPNANAILDITSTTKAFMPPRMTTTEKNAIASPTNGMVIFDSTLGKLCVYSGGWQTVTSV